MSIEVMLIIGLGVFLIAFAFAPLGMGGGMLFVPILHYGAGWAIDGRIIAVSLTLTAVVSYGSGLAHRRKGFVDDAVVKTGLVGAIPGALIGVMIVTLLGSHLDTVFKTLSLAMVLWAIIKTISKMHVEEDERKAVLGRPVKVFALRMGAAVGGVLSSVLAIGAGVVYVPIVRTFAYLGPRQAIGSSLHFMMAVTPVAILAHLAVLPSEAIQQLNSDWKFLGGLAALAFFGARTGAVFGIKRLSEPAIMRGFLTILVLVGVRYTIDLTGF
ncbi:MAG: sulfite exporter TauE/SafE family protein [Candidatus Poseidoniaceae archaeon]|nr:sulfite exporter TauE/SafE family protein [Candidatus Poseidoniaceae archaeon]